MKNFNVMVSFESRHTITTKIKEKLGLNLWLKVDQWDWYGSVSIPSWWNNTLIHKGGYSRLIKTRFLDMSPQEATKLTFLLILFKYWGETGLKIVLFTIWKIHLAAWKPFSEFDTSHRRTRRREENVRVHHQPFDVQRFLSHIFVLAFEYFSKHVFSLWILSELDNFVTSGPFVRSNFHFSTLHFQYKKYIRCYGSRHADLAHCFKYPCPIKVRLLQHARHMHMNK